MTRAHSRARSRSQHDFATVRSEGALLPPDLLARIQAGDTDLPALTPEAYHLPGGMRLNEAAARAWNALLGAWSAFRDAQARMPEGDPGTSVTRERWLLPLFQELGYGRLETRKAVTIDGKSYALSHGYKHAPIHLIGCNVDLDRRAAGVAGATAGSPHSLVQEFLNRRDDNLWGVTSNGLRLRILRDNLALTRQAYLEFDLEAMMEGEAYSDFVLLYLTLHQSRLEADDPHATVLEAWSREAAETGTRVLKDLSTGVETAIRALGEGFLRDRGNAELKRALRDGTLTTHDYYRQLLRLVYRLLFLFVAEDRDALHPPNTNDEAREQYAWYSTRKLREQVDTVRGGRHPDAYERLKVVFRALGGDGAPELGLPALGSFLFSDQAAPDAMRARQPNAYLYRAVRALAYAQVDGMRRTVDYKNLGSEELGGVYEGLLELHPEVDATAGTFHLGTAAGNERKTSGSYYTPTSLITLLLDSALDPVLDERTRGKTADEAEQALLDTKVVDPACGSGHFLIAAGQRIGKRLARIRTGDDEPAPEDVRTAVRDVVGRCLYGVDVNPMSAELCKVALWMEALEPGKPLSFLEHRIQVGNSLIGATPKLIADGIPDDAYNPIEGDDKKLVTAVRKKNREERGGQGDLFGGVEPTVDPDVARAFASIEAMPSDDVHQLRAKEEALAKARADDRHTRARRVADAWCAAFVWPLNRDVPPPITTAAVHAVMDGRALEAGRQAQVEALREDYQFFHWHVAYPEVLHDANAGFDVVLGNPPWERLKIQEKEWFANRVPEIADAANAAARKRLIRELDVTHPDIARDWKMARRWAEGGSLFCRASGRYPLGGVGDVNTYAVFADLAYGMTSAAGAAGMVLPNGLLVGYTYRAFAKQLLETRRLHSFYGFENEEKIFPAVHNETKFGLLTMNGAERPVSRTWFTGHVRSVRDVVDPAKRYALSVDEIKAINPNSLTIPIFRWAKDANVMATIHKSVPALIRRHADGRVKNPWSLKFRTVFHMANDSDKFVPHKVIADKITRFDGVQAVLDDGGRYYPLLEGKMLWHFDHRYGTYEGQTRKQANKGVLPHVSDDDHSDPHFRIQPRYWVTSSVAEEALAELGERSWCFAWRDVGPSERTFVGCIAPTTVSGHKAPVMTSGRSPSDFAAAIGLFSSVVVDYSARQRGSGMTFFIVEQLPMPTPEALAEPCPWSDGSFGDYLAERVVELSYTSYDLEPFARELGLKREPFPWIPERRRQVQAEIDAAALHLYGLDREQSEWLLDSFTVLRKYEERDHQEFLTRRLVLEAYERLAAPGRDAEAVHAGGREGEDVE